MTDATADYVYFVSGVHLYAMNAGTGALRWGLLICDARSRLSWEGEDLEKRLPQRLAPPALQVESRLDAGSSRCTAGLAVQNDKVFVTSHSFTFALDAESGQMLWEHYTGFNTIVLRLWETRLCAIKWHRALSTANGSERWSYLITGNSVTSMLVIGNDMLYTGSYDNAVYALDCSSGQARWIYQAGGRVYVAPIVDQGIVYAGSGDDGPRIFALDAHTGNSSGGATTVTPWRNWPLRDVLYTSDAAV